MAVILGNFIPNSPASWMKTAADGFIGMYIGWQPLCRTPRRECPAAPQKKCASIEKGFDRAWRDKVIQMQIPLFAPTTKGQWGLRFDSFLAPGSGAGAAPDRGTESCRPHWWCCFAKPHAQGRSRGDGGDAGGLLPCQQAGGLRLGGAAGGQL